MSTLIDLLSQYKISSETDILNTSLNRIFNYQNNNLTVYHPSASDKWIFDVKNASFAEISQLSNFLGMTNVNPLNENTPLKLNTTIEVDQTSWTNNILPALEQFLRQQKDENPGFIEKYQALSRNKFEKKSVSEIISITYSILNKLHSMELTEATFKLVKVIHHIRDVYNCIADDRMFTLDTPQAQDELLACLCKFPEIEKTYFKDSSLLSDLKSQMNQYNINNRFQSEVYAQNLTHMIADYLNEHDMAFSSCNVIEDTLLRLAQITSVTDKAKTDISKNDKANVTFKYFQLHEQDAKKLLKYLSQYDLTATEQINYHFGGFHFECAKVESSAAKPDKKEPSPFKDYIFSIDCRVFVESVYPLIQAEIERMEKDSPEELAKYKEASKGELYVKLHDVKEELSPLSKWVISAVYKDSAATQNGNLSKQSIFNDKTGEKQKVNARPTATHSM